MKSLASWASVCLIGMVSLFLQAADSAPRWWKGNLHTHSLWSDGDDYPEMIMDWYHDHGYHFAVLSDHNVLQRGERWSDVLSNKGGIRAYEKYIARFGADWVESREDGGKLQVRLKALSEYSPLFTR